MRNISSNRTARIQPLVDEVAALAAIAEPHDRPKRGDVDERDLTEVDSYRGASRLEGITEAVLERRHGVLVEVSLRDDQNPITIGLDGDRQTVEGHPRC